MRADQPTNEAADAPLDAETSTATATAATATATAPTPRPRLFKMPDFREDFRQLPHILLTRKLLWIPLLLLFIGTGIILILPSLSAEPLALADLFLQFFYVPPALFTFFIAGFIAPRASWLIGLLYGLIAGVLWFIAFIPPSLVSTPTAFATQLFLLLANGALYGTFAAAFAAWYRDFLRGMQERGRTRRAEQEANEKIKRREEKRIAKQQRPTT
jgi:hypothetical protein